MITGQEFLKFYADNMRELRSKTNASHDQISDLVVNVFDKIEAGSVQFDDYEKLESYFLLSCLNNQRQDRNRQARESQNAEEYQNQLSDDQPDVEVNLYDVIMQYVFANYPFLHAAAFKAYCFNRITYQQLSEDLGWSYNKTYRTVTKIKEDITKRYGLREN